jgi:acetyl-CoA synthetase
MNPTTVTPGRDYDAVRRAFRWQIPSVFNIGEACSDEHPPGSTAVIEFDPDGEHRKFSFGELSEASNRLANALLALGLQPNDRVAILVPQSFSTVVAHLGIYKAELVAVPLSPLFGVDALRHRIVDSNTRALIVSEPLLQSVEALAGEVGAQLIVAATEEASSKRLHLAELLATARSERTPSQRSAASPAFIIYTSGTTAAPKGALHAHRSLFGHLPGFELSHGLFPQDGDLFWTPADWAWIGGLMDAVIPTLYFGKPIVAGPPGRFDPDTAVRIMVELDVRNVFLPPTALRLLRQSDARVHTTNLRTVMSAGEALDAATLDWFRRETGLTVAEMYGQTEANYLIGNCPDLYPVQGGSMGRPYPGHTVEVIDETGEPVDAGQIGEIALVTPDPVVFLEYLNQPEATTAKYSDRRLRTGDLAVMDADGYLWFKGRADDVIVSAGYRIAPVEIEACLLQHPSVGAVAVVGIPDETRGQVVKAFVVPAKSTTPDVEELRMHVRRLLAAYEAPREIEFVAELPLTITGKIRRRDLAKREGTNT